MPAQSPKKGFSPGGNILLAILVVVSLVLVIVFASEGQAGPLHSVQNAVSGLSSPFKIVGASVGSAGDEVASTVEDAAASDDSLNSLRDQNKELRQMIAQLEEYRLESERLQTLLELKDMYAMESKTARVIGESGNAWSQVVTIDKGSNDGVKTGLSVMGGYGLIGQVITTTPFTADVRLLTDSQSGVSAMVQSSRAEGIVRGSLEGLLYLDSVSADAQIEVGDIVVTSGLGGSHFKGLIIGTVASVTQKQGDAVPKIVIAPNGNTGPLEEVLVVFEVDPENADAVSSRIADVAEEG